MAKYSDGYITGRLIPEWFIQEVNDRGAAKPSDKWKVSKKTWMSLTSFSSEPFPLADFEKRTVDDFYTTHDESETGRIVPQPAINTIEVGTTGANGAMRKGTITFTLYSIEQLRKAQRAYFVPGLTAFAQWGWNMKSDGSPIERIPNDAITNSNSMYDLQDKINSYSKTNNGSTEGICGVISDFNWSFDPSSKSYKCEITVDSPGKAYVSGPINVAPKKVTAGCKSGGMLDDGSGQWMKIVLKDMAESQIKKSKVWRTDTIAGFSINLDEDAKEDAGWWSTLTGWFGSSKTNYYVSWAWWESAIISGLSPISPNYKTSKALYNKSNFSPFQGHWKKSHVWRLDSSKSRLKVADSIKKPWGSTDPWVCIVPGHAHWTSANAVDGSLSPYSEFGIGGNAGYNEIHKTAAATTLESRSGLKRDTAKGEGNYCLLGRIYLNTYFLWQASMQAKTIDEYIMAVAKKVNEVCGSFWDLELVDDPKDPSVMRVIDRNYIPKPAKATVPVMNLLGNTSARSWGVSTDIPQSLRHAVMMGTQKKAGNSEQSNSNEAMYTYLDYAEGIKDTMVGEQRLDGAQNAGEGCEGGMEKSEAGSQQPTLDTLKKNIREAFHELAENRSDETCDAALGAMKAYHNAFGENSPASSGGTAIPIGVDLTLDGIGGLSWGYLFATDYTPQVMKKDHCFQVKAVKHTVGQDDWTTTLESALRITA